MSSRKQWCICAIVLTLFCLPSGGTSSKLASTDNSILKKEITSLLSVFSDFEFVGSDNYQESYSPQHGMDKNPLPDKLEVGRAYVFHHRYPSTNLGIFETLQSRLRENGMQVKTSSGTTYRYVGGLAFLIEFQHSEYKGFIKTQLDKEILNSNLSDKWMSDDYLLVIQQADIKGQSD
jgi:hypothetical protein